MGGFRDIIVSSRISALRPLFSGRYQLMLADSNFLALANVLFRYGQLFGKIRLWERYRIAPRRL